MKRKLFSGSVAALLGTLAAANLFSGTLSFTAFICLIAATIVGACFNAYITRSWIWPALWAVFILAMGYFSFRLVLHEVTLMQFYGKECTVEGYISDVRVSEYDRYTITVNTQRIVCGENTFKRRSKILIYSDSVTSASYGRKITVTDLSLSSALGGGYYYMSKGIHATANADAENISMGGFTNPSPLSSSFIKIKTALSDTLTAYLDSDVAALTEGVLIGDTSRMDKDLEETFRRCGLSHITAVSGFNLTLIASAIISVFAVFKLRNSILSKIICLLFIWLFTFFTGASLSVVRAAIMFTIFIISEIVMRQNDQLTSLGYAALILLFINPASLFDVGFQLSFAATLTILVFCNPLSRLFGIFLPSFLTETCAATLAAQIGVFPVLALHFNLVPATGLIANIIIVPIVPFITAGGLLIFAFSFIPFVSHFIAYMHSLLCEGVFYVARSVASFPFATVSIPSLSAIFFAFYIFAAMLLYFAVTKKFRRLSALSFGFIMLILFYFVFLYNPAALVTFLDVGSGDCAILRQSDCTIMVDSGGVWGYDIGKEKIMPYMRQHSIDKISLALITHYHRDHAAAYITLLKNNLIDTICLPDMLYPHPLAQEIEEAAISSGCRILRISPNMQIEIGKFKIETMLNVSSRGDEDASYMYKAHYGNMSVLFAGDVSAADERRLTSIYDVDCDILKVPHHGADTSSSSLFLKAASPYAAVISVGKNSYGHPSEKVLNRILKNSSEVYRTDTQGTVTIKFNEGRIISSDFER